ncbi:MAG: helix-turn-helix transcriptional regulator [Bacteroidota bacterium]
MYTSDLAATEAALNSFAVFNHKDFAEAIKAKKMPGDTLRKLQPKIGLSTATISRAINGHSISMESVLKICKWLDQNINEFLVADVTSC